MKIYIKGLETLFSFKPQFKTYAIRIWSPSPVIPQLKKHLPLDHPNFLCVQEYFFDDVWPRHCSATSILFDGTLAQKILEDFNSGRKDCEALLVHCTAGKNRSPAVTIALNEVFKLGHNTAQLKAIYHEANWYVYRTLVEKAKELGF